MKVWGSYSLTGVSVAAAACLIDQFYKIWMVGLFESGRLHKIVLAPFFDVILVWNPGISYGLFPQDSDAGKWALIAFSAAAVLALFYWLAQIESRLPANAAGLIIGGALGNVIDRLHYGKVADFFSFHVGGFNWYIFNLADVAIVAGVAGLLYDSLRPSHKSAGNRV